MERLAILNRDTSFLAFNRRVSDETLKSTTRLGEKVMFHGITFSNLDEMLQVRYPSSIEEVDRVSTEELIVHIDHHYATLMHRWHEFNNKQKIVRSVKDLNKEDSKWAERYFKQNVFPSLLPITVDKARRANIRSGVYLLVITEHDDEESVGYIEIPSGLDRFIPIPGKTAVIAIEDLVKENLKSVIHERKIVRVFPFSILRSAEVYVQADRSADPYQLIQQTLHEREKSWITAVEVGTRNKDCVKMIRKLLRIENYTIVFTTDMVHLADLKKIPSEIYKESDRPRSVKPRITFPSTGIFDYIRRKDRLCFHPYESYEASVVKFLEAAANDPDVVTIRICLYRVSNNSRIIDALLRAADTGKLVTVLVELKARFDEKHNMEIAQILREGGIRIVYTKPDIKTHAKVCLVTRKEKKGLRIYSHVGTGNYSEANSKLYTDYSYFTANQEIGTDLTKFFNLLTSDQGNFKSRKIIYAPYNLKSTIISGINEQIKRAKKKKDAQITIKCNALTDEGIASKLLDAAKEGVQITLIIRSACILQPRKNIRIFSIVGQQLEHSRIIMFGSGQHAKVMIGSSDLMTRNLSRRNELMILVEPKDLKTRIINHINMYLRDTVNRRRIDVNYKYTDMKPKKGKKPFDCQAEFMREAKTISEDM